MLRAKHRLLNDNSRRNRRVLNKKEVREYPRICFGVFHVENVTCRTRHELKENLIHEIGLIYKSRLFTSQPSRMQKKVLRTLDSSLTTFWKIENLAKQVL